MENFLTWELLLTFSGCVAGTVLLTEWSKKLYDGLPTQLVSFVIATAILLIGHAATGTFAWMEAPLYLVNAVAVSLSANGGFDILDRAFNKQPAIMDELVIADSDNGKDTYLDLTHEPEAFEDGEIVAFRVKKISSQE